jgi:7-cyano-7-deazaguanine synthase
MKKKAIVLLSGGLDSATVLAIAQSLNFATYALSFSYGQRHKIELESAKKIATEFGVVEHKIAQIDLRIFGNSALTDEIDVPKNQNLFETNKKIPITYVPARNTIFLSYALAYAEIVGAKNIFIGVNAVDYSGYPDCRIEFIKAFENLAQLATAAGVSNEEKIEINAPLIFLSKKEIIERGVALNVDYSKTHSCYDPIFKNNQTYSCKSCDSCKLRLDGFAAANIKDPLQYN